MLKDSFGRSFTYLRLSVTEACNFRCIYCLPDGFSPSADKPEELSVFEIKNLLSAFVELGIRKVRITGGEPCLRKDLGEIIQTVRSFDDIQTIALTTNGTGMYKYLSRYIDLGLNALNLSLDSLDQQRFKEVTGKDRLSQLMKVIEQAQSLPLDNLKANAVLMHGLNDKEFEAFLDFVADKKIVMRFIELMETSDMDPNFLKEKQIYAASSIERLLQAGWVEEQKQRHGGPSRVFSHKDSKGKIGFITPYGANFCSDCNRLRVSSRGKLQLCLFGQGEVDLRPFLQRENQKDDLKNIISSVLFQKRETHQLHQKDTGIRKHLASIGG